MFHLATIHANFVGSYFSRDLSLLASLLFLLVMQVSVVFATNSSAISGAAAKQTLSSQPVSLAPSKRVGPLPCVHGGNLSLHRAQAGTLEVFSETPATLIAGFSGTSLAEEEATETGCTIG